MKRVWLRLALAALTALALLLSAAAAAEGASPEAVCAEGVSEPVEELGETDLPAPEAEEWAIEAPAGEAPGEAAVEAPGDVPKGPCAHAHFNPDTSYTTTARISRYPTGKYRHETLWSMSGMVRLYCMDCGETFASNTISPAIVYREREMCYSPGENCEWCGQKMAKCPHTGYTEVAKLCSSDMPTRYNGLYYDETQHATWVWTPDAADKLFICDECGAVAAQVTVDGQPTLIWATDDDELYEVCGYCQSECVLEPHMYVDGVCTGCGHLLSVEPAAGDGATLGGVWRMAEYRKGKGDVIGYDVTVKYVDASGAVALNWGGSGSIAGVWDEARKALKVFDDQVYVLRDGALGGGNAAFKGVALKKEDERLGQTVPLVGSWTMTERRKDKRDDLIRYNVNIIAVKGGNVALDWGGNGVILGKWNAKKGILTVLDGQNYVFRNGMLGGGNAKYSGVALRKGDLSKTYKAAKKVSLNKSKLTLKAGGTATLKASLPKGAYTTKLTWKSSAPKVAKVDANGRVTALKKGTAVITVKTANGKKAACKVTVKPAG